MSAVLENVRADTPANASDRWMDEQNDRLKDVEPGKEHPLDTFEAKKKQTRLLEWYQLERERQAANRYQMAIDQDFYDNLQWSEEDIAELAERGQAAYTYNEIAPTIDWIIGTEKRTRVDFKVLPREEDDVQGADTKTKVLKYLGDVNKVGFARSLAFADAVKVGVGWMEDGARGDPTDEPVFSRYESWRNIIWDSMSVERDLTDARYIFRWKWVDLDVAIAMFPDREQQLRRAAVAANLWGNEDDEDFWYLGQHFQARDAAGQVIGRRTFVSDAGMVHNRRERVKLIECWYRMPTRCQVCRGDKFNGHPFDKENPEHVRASLEGVISVFDQLQMKVHCAIMTEGDLLQDVPSPYRHNRFPFTPIWCYRRGRDGMVYGVIRRIRDPQEDLNKRASKALFILSSRGIIADSDALDGTGLTWDDIREEAARPDYLITKKKGADIKFERDVQLAEEHIQLMDMNGRRIRSAGGVTDENLGHQTNAISGKAIAARQLQGSVVTAEIFDNERFAIQVQGEIQLSLAEQYISEPKVIRLTGAKGKLDWVKINQPVTGPDGTVTFENDITARQADFVVDTQDFHQSVRQAMFESMADLVGKVAAVNAEAGMRILRMALEMSDMPNKEEMAGEIKHMLGIVDPEDVEKMTPEERQQYEQGLRDKAEQGQLAKQGVVLALHEQAAKSEKLLADSENARAAASEHVAKAIAIQQESLSAIGDLAKQVQELSDVIKGVLPEGGGVPSTS